MERSEILEKLKDILRMLESCPEETIENIREDSDLSTDLALTSVGMLYVVIAAEETFDIRFDDASFGDFRTVRDVLDYIGRKVSE